MCTAAPDKCHLLSLSKVADAASPTAEQLPRTGMQEGTCVCLGHTKSLLVTSSTDPSSAVVLSVSWAAAEQVCFHPSAGRSQGLATSCPEVWLSQGCHCMRFPRAPQSSGTPINTSGFQHWKAHEQRPWVFTARIPTKWIKLTFSENKWKKHSTDICYEFL